MSHLFPTLLLTALGCTGAPTPETDAVYAYGAALSSEHTLHAREACLALTDEALRVDCVWRFAEKETKSAALIQELGFPPDQDSLWLSAWLWSFKALDAPPVAACGDEDTAAQRSRRFALWQVWPELKPVEVRAGVPAGWTRGRRSWGGRWV